MTIFLNFFFVKRGNAKSVEETLFLLDILRIFHYNKAVDLLFQLIMFWFFESCRGNLDMFILWHNKAVDYIFYTWSSGFLAIQSSRGYPCDIFYCIFVYKNATKMLRIFFLSFEFLFRLVRQFFFNFFSVKRGKAVE